MADSLSHKIGECIGSFFEKAIVDYLRSGLQDDSFYVDYRHERPARKNKKEVIGTDNAGNKHKLDIVIEKDGTEQKAGVPKAFIEVAWRRYTKHSKNKVQEIAGAILPLVRTYAREVPFYAAVLAGDFTGNAITQLKSQGFFVLYFTYEEICELFETADVSIRWEEITPTEELEGILQRLKQFLAEEEHVQELQQRFFQRYATQLQELRDELHKALYIAVSEVTIVPIHGQAHLLASVQDAISFITQYDETTQAPLMRYEITIRYTNGQEYMMRSTNRRSALQYLNTYLEK